MIILSYILFSNKLFCCLRITSLSLWHLCTNEVRCLYLLLFSTLNFNVYINSRTVYLKIIYSSVLSLCDPSILWKIIFVIEIHNYVYIFLTLFQTKSLVIVIRRLFLMKSQNRSYINTIRLIKLSYLC